mmetsp:Transcript_13548/g.56694  ORF Transcript_13548/g.56694 Transcript_13548/m.56694 type:complete len:252 (-) Transcript_13548:263-1018(-)
MLHVMVSRSRTCTSLSRRPLTPSPPKSTTLLSPTRTAACPVRATGGSSPATLMISQSPLAGLMRRTAHSSLASSLHVPPTRYIEPRHATAAAAVTAFTLDMRVHVRLGRSSHATSPSLRPLRLPPTTNKPVPTTAAACRYLPAGARPDVVTLVHFSTRAVPAVSDIGAGPERPPEEALAAALGALAAATGAGRELQSGTVSSRVRTYRRIASTEGMSPRLLQLVHLALSTTFQPQGLGSMQGPAVACLCSA